MSRVCLNILLGFLFIDERTDIAQRRMPPCAIVKRLQILEEDLASVGTTLKRLPIHAFLFDRSEEALHQRIIVTIGFSTHAHFNAIAFQQSPISMTRKLAATIGMMQQARMGTSSTNGH